MEQTINEIQEKNKAFELSLRATLQLYSFSGEINDGHLNDRPTNFFSGCIYRDYILSVLHGKDNKDSKIAAFISDSKKGPKYAILNPSYFGLVSLNSKQVIQNGLIDFIFSKYDVNNQFMLEMIDEDSQNRFAVPRYIFKDIVEPNFNEKYFFSGNIYASLFPQNGEKESEIYERKRIYFSEQFQFCHFDGYPKTDEVKIKDYIYDLELYYRFELDDIIEDEDDFKGCSGAPIMNMKGELISILCSGKIGDNFIYGINLKKLIEIVKINGKL